MHLYFLDFIFSCPRGLLSLQNQVDAGNYAFLGSQQENSVDLQMLTLIILIVIFYLFQIF